MWPFAYLERLIPATQDPATTARQDLLYPVQLPVRGLATERADRALDGTCNAHAACPSRHLAQGDCVDPLVEPANALFSVDVAAQAEG